MPPTAQPSFIPHDAKQARGSRGHADLADLLILVGVVLLVVSGALAGGVAIYKQMLATNNANKLKELNADKAAFDPKLVQTLQRLDDRMNAAEQILQQHLAPLALFTTLEQTTSGSVQFTSLNFDANNPQHITLKMTGLADSVNAVAYQSDLFTKSGAFPSPIFANISRQQDGVHFDYSSQVNPASLNYVQLLQGQSASNQIPSASAPGSSGQGQASTASSTQGTSAGNPNPFTAPSSGQSAQTSQ